MNVDAADEVGELAEAFNRMTHDLLEQKDRLVQTERVAAWRELARRLAHELKNPLFPLQLTVENLIRAREQSSGKCLTKFFQRVPRRCWRRFNLKAIIGRFSEFSRMPQPHVSTACDVNELVEGVVRLFQAQFRSRRINIAFTAS